MDVMEVDFSYICEAGLRFVRLCLFEDEVFWKFSGSGTHIVYRKYMIFQMFLHCVFFIIFLVFLPAHHLFQLFVSIVVPKHFNNHLS